MTRDTPLSGRYDDPGTLFPRWSCFELEVRFHFTVYTSVAYHFDVYTSIPLVQFNPYHDILLSVGLYDSA